MKKSVIERSAAIKAIADSNYYFIDSDGKGIDASRREEVAKEMLEGAPDVHFCPVCGMPAEDIESCGPKD